MAPVSGWIRFLGTVLIIILPLLVASALHGSLASLPGPVRFGGAFLLVGIAAQVGLIVRRWGKIEITRLLFDILLLLVAGVLAWVVTDVAVHRGGGAVDPSLLAVIMAYLLALWSGQHP